MPFGYGALISDIRVSFGTGRHLDGLQKIYSVGSMMMAGFAGSVDVGFEMIEDLQRSFYLEQPADASVGKRAWYVEQACWRWHRRGRRIFAAAPVDLRRLGCELLLVGASPIPNAPFGGISRCIQMSAPDFLPIRVRSSWASIGTGALHETARHYAENFFSVNAFSLLKGEVGNAGGAATTTAMFVAIGLGKAPMESVSPLLQVGQVSLAAHSIEGLRVGPPTEPNESRHTPVVRLARSREELYQMCDAIGADAASGQA